jgi:hypothetical protein
MGKTNKIDNVLAPWVVAVGGCHVATKLVLEHLKCSPAKAEQIVRGTYPWKLPRLEFEALVKVTKLSEKKISIYSRDASLKRSS